MDWRDIPSLAALRAFEAAARCGSFTKAASELNVTHAAIAQHVRAIEADLANAEVLATLPSPCGESPVAKESLVGGSKDDPDDKKKEKPCDRRSKKATTREIGVRQANFQGAKEDNQASSLQMLF